MPSCQEKASKYSYSCPVPKPTQGGRDEYSKARRRTLAKGTSETGTVSSGRRVLASAGVKPPSGWSLAGCNKESHPTVYSKNTGHYCLTSVKEDVLMV